LYYCIIVNYVKITLKNIQGIFGQLQT